MSYKALADEMSRSKGWVTSSSTQVPDVRQPHMANATWSTAEKALMDGVQGDVFGIFDCCYAGDMQRSLRFGNSAYEVLAASRRNNTTPAPGPLSFTGDLIKSLKELLEERKGNPFATYDLLNKITDKRPDGLEPTLLDRRFGIDGLPIRHILIAPHKPEQRTRPEDFVKHYPNTANLTLTFELGYPLLEEKQLECLAKNLPSVFKQAKIPLRRVHWRAIEARSSFRRAAIAIGGISTWRRRLNRIRRNRTGRQAASPSRTTR